jgi:hypothetical protein
MSKTRWELTILTRTKYQDSGATAIIQNSVRMCEYKEYLEFI